MARRISSRVASGFSSKRALALMMNPGVQNPHWSAWFSRTASCTGSSFPSQPTPSMVTTFRPSTAGAGTRQAVTALPSIITVQAPHSPIPQPSLVPVRRRSSLSISKSLWWGFTSTWQGFPFNVKLIFIFSTAIPPFLLPGTGPEVRFPGPQAPYTGWTSGRRCALS